VIKNPHRLKRLTAALRQSLERARERSERSNMEERFRELFESVPVGLVRCTPDDPILAGNPALARILGCPDRETLLRTAASRFWVDPDEHRRFLADMERDGVVRHREVEARRFEGDRIWLLLDARCVRDERGRFPYYEGSVIDITGRRELESQLRQAQKMEAIGRLAGGAAHDFNNLLTVINGYTRLLLDRLPEGDPFRADLEQVHQAGNRAMELTQRLLAFSRRQVLEPRVVDPGALVTGLERMLRRLIPENIALVLHLDPRAGKVLADPGQLEQALMNLVTNARDAMPRGGTLTIETAERQVDASLARAHPGLRPGRCVVLSVSDTGEGFDDKTRSRLFEPFFTTKPRGRGTGLGLASVYGIVKQSGGYISAEGELGRGATFRIYLPVTERAGSEVEARSSPDPVPCGSETVLVVEDDAAVRALVRQVLEGCGYTILPAGSVEEARRLSETHPGPIHLLLADVVMPQEGGPELAARLALRRPDLRVLYISGYDDEAIARHGVLDSGAAFLKKPFTPESLAAKVRRVLDGLDRP
jgi:PAS domain S-box-containing protein